MEAPLVFLTEADVAVLREASDGPIDARGTSELWRAAVKRLTRLDMLTSGSPFDGPRTRHITARGRRWLADWDRGCP